MESIVKKLPFELTLIVTHACNLKCRYCYEHNKSTKRRMSLEIAKETLSHYMTTGDYTDVKIGFIGGEPLLEFQLIKEICEWFWSVKWAKKYVFYATTNGTILTDEMKEWFAKNRKYFWLSLSLDGTKETHDWNRSNSFDKIDLEFFKQNWPEQPVKMTIGEDRLEHLAEDMMFIHQNGFKLNGCNFAEGVSMSDFDSKLSIISEQYLKLIDFYIAHPEYEAKVFSLPLASCETRDNIHRKRCGTGENMAVIDYDGRVYPCTYFSPVSLDDEQIKQIKQINFCDVESFVDTQCNQDCYIYPICTGCYGDNFSITGSVKTRSAQKCQLAKLKALATANYMARLLDAKLAGASTVSKKDQLTIAAILKIITLFQS